MKLTEALQILHEAESLPGTPFQVLLACGFTPLNLVSFLGAHLQKAQPRRRVLVATGLYGDLAGTLEHGLSKGTEAVAVALEWADLDSRLGYRSLGGWGPAQEADLAAQVRAALGRLSDSIGRVGANTPVAVSMPTLPIPPAFHTPGWETGKTELAILAALAEFAACLAAIRGASVVNAQRLLVQSPFEQRFDLQAELLTGHSYSIPHADAVGEALARLLLPLTPKKGLITDLDNTLWSGLAGEVGPGVVGWDLNAHAQIHGLYQQTLAALAEQGVLLATASKNNPEVVEKVFERHDIRLGRDKIYPMEIHWNPKSESVGRILAAWNIAADSVVFVDDSPMELAEVKAAWPEMDCLLFPQKDPRAALALLRRVRDAFGKRQLDDEDRLRLASIRAAAAVPREKGQGAKRESFLSQMEGILTVHFNPSPTDSRILELVNKTNQFNLNGVRYTEAEWARIVDSLDSFLLSVSYEDKYGPLGKIAMLAGRRENHSLRIQTWVMSCRAFSRRIEHGCMAVLFSRFEVDELRLDYATTPKNRPFQECFVPLLGAPPEGPFTVTRAQFEKHCPPRYYKVNIIHE